MEREQNGEDQQRREQEARRESGLPGGGQGRRDEVGGRSGVYRVSDAQGASPDAPLRSEAEWGQGELGAAGSEESGSSELNFDPERQAGLLNTQDEGTGAEQSGQ